MHIGLIGGIGPAATDLYYRGLIKALADSPSDLDVTIAHADSPTLLKNLTAEDADAQAAIFERLTGRLKAAGAQAVAVTSIGGHFCIKEFKAVSPLPVLDLLTSVTGALEQQGLGTVGILGTKTVMRSAMYGQLPALNVVPPEGPDLDAVHQAYVDMATAGTVTEAQRRVFFDCGRDLCERRDCEAVLLGGTDLFLAFDGHDPGFRAIDCALLHIADLAREAERQIASAH